jgi:L-lactate utilization protein LutB
MDSEIRAETKRQDIAQKLSEATQIRSETAQKRQDIVQIRHDIAESRREIAEIKVCMMQKMDEILAVLSEQHNQP